ncbi:MAG: MFS transporter, partial [Chloroflexota bacterium]|nr:MFS transporter [Chloroflexota bacterium]
VVALTGVPAGRLIDRIGTHRMTNAGLIALGAGAFTLVVRATSAGVAEYIVSMVVATLGYGLFQTANNTAIMRDVEPNQRGVVSGLANLSRNLGLITGASAMGAVFAFASGTSDFATAPPDRVADGMRATYAVATILIAIALVVARPIRPVAIPTSLDALKQSPTA